MQQLVDPAEDLAARYATEYLVERRERHELASQVFPGRLAGTCAEFRRKPAVEGASGGRHRLAVFHVKLAP